MDQSTSISRHSQAEIIKSLRLLEQNNFNYLLTSRQTGIARTTLKAWEKKYGSEVFSVTSPREEALAEIDAEMKQNDINIIRYLYSLRKRTLHKISMMADDETRIEPLLSVLKYVSAEIDKFAEIQKSENEKSPKGFIEMITAQLKASKQQESQEQKS